MDPTLKGHTVKDPTVDLSDAIVTFLKNYPGSNDVEFRARFGADVQDAVHRILEETSRTRVEWGTKTLIEIGDEIGSVMHRKHPELSAAALEELGNYFTYLVR